MLTYEAAGHTFSVKDPVEGMKHSFSHDTPCEGITDLMISITAEESVVPTKTRICWKVPVIDIHYKWNPMSGRHTYLDFMKGCYNKLPTRANGPGPVMALYDMACTNALTFALDDAMHDNDLSIGLDERGFLDCSIGLFQTPWDVVTEYTCTFWRPQAVTGSKSIFWERSPLRLMTTPTTPCATIGPCPKPWTWRCGTSTRHFDRRTRTL